MINKPDQRIFFLFYLYIYRAPFLFFLFLYYLFSCVHIPLQNIYIYIFRKERQINFEGGGGEESQIYIN